VRAGIRKFIVMGSSSGWAVSCGAGAGPRRRRCRNVRTGSCGDGQARPLRAIFHSSVAVSPLAPG
jgi:hypothetical protein